MDDKKKIEPTQESFNPLIGEMDKRLGTLGLAVTKASWLTNSGADVVTFTVTCKRCAETGTVDMTLMVHKDVKEFPDLMPMASVLEGLLTRWYVDRHHLALDAQISALRQAKMLQGQTPIR